ncbi:MAG TPA: hypothetical protein VN694_07250 [Caulobacteraceae bacterium]|nr:hypothetical protein [Caulobacteraceae bacterium]
MNKVVLSTFAGVAAAALLGTVAQAEPTAVPLNGEATVGGVQVGCTGIGQSRHDPKWAAFPVRIDFAKPNGHFLADVEVTLSRADGTEMADVSCQGPQVLFKLPAGSYRVEGRLTKSPNAKPQTATVTAATSGQRVTTLRFRDA